MIVLVYGYDGSGPGHWQRWLEEELRRSAVEVSFPALPDPTAPRCDVWVDRLASEVERATRPVTFVCHSLGCWAVDHLISRRGAAGIDAALLVAPPSPYLLFEAVESFLPPPLDQAAWAPIASRSTMIGSDDDDFTSIEEFRDLAAQLGVSFEPLAGAGHVNTASGFGPWPRALAWLDEVGALPQRSGR